MQSKGVAGLRADELIVTTGSQQALDLVGKTLLDPQDTVLVESPTFFSHHPMFPFVRSHRFGCAD